MSVNTRFKQWQKSHGDRFEDAAPALSLQARLDAAEYELQSIMRDIAKVRLSEPQNKASHR
jgi:hypothetical protein